MQRALVWASLLVALAAAPVRAAVLADWDFDSLKGVVVPDLSGHGNDVTVTLAALVKGVSGRALRFDGRDTSAVCFGGASGQAGSSLTLEAWVRPGESLFPNFPAILRKEGHYALRFAGNRLGFLVWAGGEPRSCNSSTTEWPEGKWVHVVATAEGTDLRLYLDGREDASVHLEFPVRVQAAPVQCFVGCGPGGYRLRGDLDNVRVLDTALGAAEVRGRYEAGLAALAKERDLTVTEQTVGERPKPFRKPAREVTMVHDGFLWIDAEDFGDYGGWTLDTQFVHLIGSGYLLAGGTGTPVADATATVRIDKPGSYRLWARTRNWLQEYSPGTFGVLVNGAAVAATFGRADSDDWLWEDGGSVTLPAGTNTLALHDLTGYYGRCDALLLARDQGYRPPNKLAELTAERSRLTGLSLVPKPRGQWDVIVVGAGAAGCCAAISAARNGARTALIQDRPVLGGNSSTEAGVPINGAASCHPNAREGGVIEECGRVKARYGYPQMSRAFAEVAAAEPNLTVFTNQRVIAATMASPARIATVQAVDTLTGERGEYAGRMFIDCTGDGWVGYYAGAKFRFGREARGEYHESLAPEAADAITMSGCLMGGNCLSYRAVDTGKPASYTPPPWAPRFDSMTGYGRQVRYVGGGNWWLEHRGTLDDLWSPEQARDELLRITYGYWDFIKNRWEKKDQAASYALVSVPVLDARRETRRLIGDYVLTQNDCQAGTVFPDAICHGGWPLDVHHPEGIYSKPEEGAFHSNTHVPIYTIPFRSLYSANIENLLMAGRDMSVTHIALGTVRVQGTLAAAGQAAGTGAALALRHQTTPRGLYRDHLPELQRVLLKQDQHIPGLKLQDPQELAHTAREVACSSQADYELFRREDVKPEESHELTCDRAMLLAAGKAPQALYLLLGNGTAKKLTVPLYLAPLASAAAPTTPLTVGPLAEAEVPPGEQWVRFPVKRWVDTPLALVWLRKTEGLSWRLMRTAPPGASRAYGEAAEGHWTVVAGQYYALYADPALRSPGDMQAANVTDGRTRPSDGHSGLWSSDPEQALPQWVELRFAHAVEANRVHLVLDTDVNAPYHDVALVPQCVRDYEVTAFDGKQWRSLVQVTGNFQRHRVHAFDTLSVEKLRLTVTGTNGSPAARVYEVRLYRE